jgi:hypothetical protein
MAFLRGHLASCTRRQAARIASGQEPPLCLEHGRPRSRRRLRRIKPPGMTSAELALPQRARPVRSPPIEAAASWVSFNGRWMGFAQAGSMDPDDSFVRQVAGWPSLLHLKPPHRRERVGRCPVKLSLHASCTCHCGTHASFFIRCLFSFAVNGDFHSGSSTADLGRQRIDHSHRTSWLRNNPGVKPVGTARNARVLRVMVRSFLSAAWPGPSVPRPRPASATPRCPIGWHRPASSGVRSCRRSR